MLRKDIEQFMKDHDMRGIDLYKNADDDLAMMCHLKNGYLTDWTNHRVDRNTDFWGYMEWDGLGNADRICFETGERIPAFRKSIRVR